MVRAWMGLPLLVGCSAIETREPLELVVRAGGSGAEPLTFDQGTVQLDAAFVTFSDLRLEEPPLSTATSWLAPLVVPAAAYAHPGHDYPGDVAAELLGTWTVDLLAEPTTVGTAVGYQGAFATGRLSVSGEVARLEGTFTPDDGAPIPFRFAVEAEQELTSLSFDHVLAEPSAVVSIGFDLENALSYVDWSDGDTDGDGELTAGDGSLANTVHFGVVATETWTVTLEGEAP